MTTPVAVTSFWRDAGMAKWFGGGDAFDAECRDRFLDAHHAAARREHAHWMDDAEGALALLILLDQIPRNVFRGSGHAFAASEPELRMFFYLPFEHSEDMADQDRAVELFAALGNDNLLAYANAHRDVIARFGRFPHRNAALGRSNTPDEQAWLDAGGGF